jgi:hypothetical protein
MFARIVGVSAHGEGHLVADGTSGDLRSFDGEGRHVATAGGMGEGPGEFGRLGGMWVVRGDTVLAWDSRTRRLTTFAPDLTLVGTEAVSREVTEYAMEGTFEDGALLLEPFATTLP